MGSELLPVHDDDDVGQDIPASKAVEIEEDIARMAGELDAAVCRRGHLESARNRNRRRMGMEKQPGKYPKPSEETAAALGCAQIANCRWQGQRQLLGPKANSPAPRQAPATLPSEVSRPTARPGMSQSHPASWQAKATRPS